MADAVSIEETNKVRIALGLQPLPVPGAKPAIEESDSDESDEELGSTLESREAEGFANWKKLQDEAQAAHVRMIPRERVCQENLVSTVIEVSRLRPSQVIHCIDERSLSKYLKINRQPMHVQAADG